MKYGLVKYSSSKSNDRLKKSNNVYEVKLKTFFQKDPHKCYEDIQTLFAAEKQNKELAKTSQPSTMEIFETIKSALENHETIFVLTPEKAMSGTHQNTIVAAGMFDENEQKRIEIIETKAFGIGEAVSHDLILDLFEDDLTRTEIREKIEEKVEKITYYAGIERLEYLANGGRFDLSKLLIGKLLRTRVIIKQKDTERSLWAKCKGAKGLILEVEKLIDDENVKVVHFLSILTDKKYQEVIESLCQQYNKEFVFHGDASAIVGAQLGEKSFLIGIEEK